MRKKNIAAHALLILALMMLVHCTSRSPGEEMAQVGQQAPAFKLRDLDGRYISLDQYKGKIVMLDFWATWCGPCRLTMPLLERLQKEYPADLALLAINLQEPRDIVSLYIQKQNLKSTVLLDQEGDVGQEYGSDSIPMQVLIDRKGIVRHVQVGYSPRMEAQLRTEINELR